MAFGGVVQTHKVSLASGEATMTFPSPATAGNKLIVVEARSAQHSAGGAWSAPAGWDIIHDAGINVVGAQLSGAAYCKVATGGETGFTTTHTNEQGNLQVAFTEFEGPYTASPLDQTQENATQLASASQSISTGTTGTTAQADELIVALFFADQYSNVDTGRSYNNGFTERVITDISAARPAAIIASKVVSATGTQECTLTTTDTGDEMYAMIATFKKDVGGGATQFEQAVDGTLTSAGTARMQTGKAVAGVVTSAGVARMQVGKALAGVLTSAGTLARQAQKALAGALSPDGAVSAVKTVLVALAGTLSSAGTLVRQTNKVLAGSVSPAGTVTRAIRKFVSGTLTTAGGIFKRTARTLAGVLGLAGNVNAEIPEPIIEATGPGARKLYGANPRLTAAASGRHAATAADRASAKAEG